MVLLIGNEDSFMIYPFCRQSDIMGTPGNTVCPSCQTVLEIEERGECVFVDTDSLRMPMFGQVCVECGLVQQEKLNSYVYCGAIFNKTVH